MCGRGGGRVLGGCQVACQGVCGGEMARGWPRSVIRSSRQEASLAWGRALSTAACARALVHFVCAEPFTPSHGKGFRSQGHRLPLLPPPPLARGIYGIRRWPNKQWGADV